MIDWRHWHNEPYLVGGLVFLGWLYAVLAGPLRAWLWVRNNACGRPPARGRSEARASSLPTTEESARPSPVEFPLTLPPFPRAQAGQFYLSLLFFYVAVGSPLDQIGERFLFSAHMFQHQLLIYPAAILFLRGLPAWMIDPVLSLPALRRPLRLLTAPLMCGTLYTLIVSLWHAPLAYDWALQNKVVHVGEHLMFFGAALFYWWPVLSPSRVFPASPYGTRMLYVLAVLIAMTPVFAYITFSETILYPTYEYAPRLIADFTPANDQLLAGVGMKLVGLCVALAAFGVCFFRWSAASERSNTPG